MDFIRFIKLIGEDKFNELSNKTIVIIGVGGVGGYTTEALARSGIKKLILIDYDSVDITNKNRQIIALDNNIGILKVEVFKDRIKKINTECEVITEPIFLDENNINVILKYNPDFIIDCCDSIKTKEELIKLSLNNNINFISSMGTGKRLDASKLQITTLDKTNYDPIAKILRKFARDNRINAKKINVIASTEQPINIDYEKIASCSYVPACAGILIASHVINTLLGNINE